MGIAKEEELDPWLLQWHPSTELFNEVTISPENGSASVIFTLWEPENGYASVIFTLREPENGYRCVKMELR